MTRSLAAVMSLVLVGAVAAPARAQDPPKPYAHLKFDGNDKNEGAGEVKVTLKNTEFKDKALVVNGIYPFGADANKDKASIVDIATPKLSYDAFTVAVRFKADAIPEGGGPVLVGGHSYRWFWFGAVAGGKLQIGLNQTDKTFDVKDTKLTANTWTVVACSVSVKDKKVIVFVNGKKADEFTLPKDFVFTVATSGFKDSDKSWMTINYSNAGTFKGQIDELLIYDTALTADQLAKVPLKP